MNTMTTTAPPVPIDEARLRADIAALAMACTNAKRLLRRTWTEPMAMVQRELARQRRRVTELLTLLAARRGKLHVVAPPHDLRDASWDARAYQARVALRVAAAYEASGMAPLAASKADA